MQVALEEASKAYEAEEVPVGAVLVRDRELIAQAHNVMYRTKNPLNHAERLVIERGLHCLSSNHLRGCELYVTLEPCHMCAGAIALVGIERVFFGAYDPKLGQIDHNHHVLRHTPIVAMGGFLEEKCASLLKSFFENRR